MFTLLVILVWTAIAFIYLLQYQIVRDYQPRVYTWTTEIIDEAASECTCSSVVAGLEYGESLECELQKYSIVDFNHIFRRYL